MAEPFSPEQAEIANKFFEALRESTRDLDPTTQEKIKAAKAAQEAKDKLNAFKEALQDATINGVISYGKAVTSSEQGFGKFGSTITGVTDVVGNFASTFGFAGKVVGAFVKIFGDVAAASLKQNDDLVKSYQQLSEMGSVTAGGIENLGDQLRSVGLTAEEFAKLTDALKPVTRDLVTFGGSVTGGRDKLLTVMGGLIGPGNEFERSLMRLGYTTQDIREGAAQYVAQQSLLGFSQNKSSRELAKGSAEYLVTLKKMQELTGMSNDEAEKAMQAQMTDARMVEHLSGMRENEAKNLQAYLASYEDQFGKDSATGLKELILNQGRIVGDASARAYQSTQGKAYEAALRAAKEGPDAFRRELKNVAGGITAQGKQFRTSLNLMGDGISDLTSDNQAQLGARRLMQESDAEYAKRMKELAATSKNAGEGMENNITNEQRTRAIRMAKEQMLAAVGSLTVSVLTKINTALFKFGKVIANLIDKFSVWLGWNNPNMSAMFRDLDDNIEDLTKAQTNKANLEKQLEDAKQKLADVRNPEEGAKRSQEAINAQKESVDKLKEALKQVPSGRQHSAERAKLEQQIDLEQKKLNGLIATRNWDKKHNISETEREKLVLKLQKNVEDARANYDKLIKENASMGGEKGIGVENRQADVAASQTSSQAGVESGKLLDFIGKAEGAGYNTKFGGEVTDLTGKSINEILALQKQMKAEGKGSTAVGKYQIINSTLASLVDQLKISKDEKFTPEMQDKLARELIRQSGSDQVKEGKMSQKQFADNLAGVWASLPKESGKSAYHGDKMNNHATVSRKQLEEVISGTPQAKLGGEFDGPKSGYPVTMHGNEIVLDEEDTISFKKFFANTGKKLDSLGQGSAVSDVLSKLNNQTNPVSQMNNMFSMTKMDIDNVTSFNNTVKQVVASIVEANKKIQEEKTAVATQSTQVQSVKAPDSNLMDDKILSVFNTMVDKLDSLIDINHKSKNIQDDILTHQRA